MSKHKAGVFAFQALAGLLYLAFAWTVTAGESERHFAIAIDVDGDRVDLQLDDMDFDPFSLAEGESRSVTGEDGRSVMFSRRGGELVMTTAEGKDVVLPDISAPDSTLATVSGDDGHERFEIEVQTQLDEPEGLLILSGKPLDESTRDTIRKALADSGIEQPVRFGGSGLHKVIIHESDEDTASHQVKIIRQERIVSQDSR